MRGQRIFLTGGTGVFGCWLVESFLYVNRMEKLAAGSCTASLNPILALALSTYTALLAGRAHVVLNPEVDEVDSYPQSRKTFSIR
jgi:hypothetical protein